MKANLSKLLEAGVEKTAPAGRSRKGGRGKHPETAVEFAGILAQAAATPLPTPVKNISAPKTKGTATAANTRAVKTTKSTETKTLQTVAPPAKAQGQDAGAAAEKVQTRVAPKETPNVPDPGRFIPPNAPPRQAPPTDTAAQVKPIRPSAIQARLEGRTTVIAPTTVTADETTARQAAAVDASIAGSRKSTPKDEKTSANPVRANAARSQTPTSEKPKSLDSVGPSIRATFADYAHAAVAATEGAVKNAATATQVRKPTAEGVTVNAVAQPAAWGSYLTQAAATDPTRAAAPKEVIGRVRTEVVNQARLVQRNGSSQVEVQLDPPEMGRIRLQVTSKDGQVEVRMQVENPAVRQALQNDQRDLQNSLRDAQVDVTQVNITDYQSGANSEHREPSGSYATPGASELSNAADEAPESGAQGWVITKAGKLDCLV